MIDPITMRYLVTANEAIPTEGGMFLQYRPHARESPRCDSSRV